MYQKITKGDVGRMIKSADFCGCGPVAQQNQLIKSVNHDMTNIFICYFVRYQPAKQLNADRKIILASLFSASNKRK